VQDGLLWYACYILAPALRRGCASHQGPAQPPVGSREAFLFSGHKQYTTIGAKRQSGIAKPATLRPSPPLPQPHANPLPASSDSLLQLPTPICQTRTFVLHYTHAGSRRPAPSQPNRGSHPPGQPVACSYFLQDRHPRPPCTGIESQIKFPVPPGQPPPFRFLSLR
jgi:hypothetical protein